MLIWEDSSRYFDYPDDSQVIYYNPVGGNRYHTNKNCPSVNSRYLPLTAFTYGELTDTRFQDLVPCTKCYAPDRPETIMEKNLANGYTD